MWTTTHLGKRLAQGRFKKLSFLLLVILHIFETAIAHNRIDNARQITPQSESVLRAVWNASLDRSAQPSSARESTSYHKDLHTRKLFACPPGSAPLTFNSFTGSDGTEESKWRFYGYFTYKYPSESSGVAGSVNFYQWNWQKHDNTWLESSDNSRGFPIPDRLWPAYDFEAHTKFMDMCGTPTASSTCVQQGSDSCHGYRVNVKTKIDTQSTCEIGGDYKHYVVRSPPLYIIDGQKINFDVYRDDDFRCHLVYQLGNNQELVARDEKPKKCCNGDDTSHSYEFGLPGVARFVCINRNNKGGEGMYFRDKGWRDVCFGCPPGKSGPDGTQCIRCEGNTYQDLYNEPECKQCPRGTYRAEDPILPNLDESAIIPPLPGSSLGDCVACPQGKYGSASGCDLCPTGKFMDELGATEISDCKPCPNGQYSSNDGSPLCDKCSRGLYTSSEQSTSAAGCLTCSSGKYADDSGYSQTQCKNCPSGFYQPHGDTGSYGVKWLLGGDCTDDTYLEGTSTRSSRTECESECTNIGCVGYSWNTANKECRLHSFLGCIDPNIAVSTATYYERLLTSSCSPCQAAKYQVEEGQPSCTDCPDATYGESIGAQTASSCLPCPAGKFGNEPYTQASKCKLCPGGTYSSASPSMSCSNECPAGKYRPASSNPADHDSADDCLVCGASFYQNAEGQTRCLGCPNALDPASTGVLNTDCAGCKPGQYKDEVDNVCKNCDSGRFTDSVDETSCKDCEQGLYTGPASGAFGSTDCIGCPRGKHGKSNVQVSTRTSETLACDACVAGKYNENEGAIDASNCESCSPGRYNEDEGSPGEAACQPCLPGKYSSVPQSSNSSDCTKCEKGKYSSDVAASSKTSCRQCPIGWYQADEGVTSCLLCVPGSVSDVPASESCVTCEEGKFSDAAGQSVCSPCAEGKYASNSGQPVCFDCTPGKYSTKVVTSDELNVECKLCPKGRATATSGSTSCQFCPMGRQASVRGLSSCTQCLLGQATMNIRQQSTNETMCFGCPVGYYTKQYGSLECNRCQNGKYSSKVGSSICTNCLPGQFSKSEGSTVCDLCPAGFYAGDESFSECYACVPGQWSAESAVGCSDCLPGKYSANSSSEFCTSCGAGYFSPQPGMNNCSTCNPGSWSLDGAISCLLCAKGRVQPLAHRDSCLSCTAGMYQGYVAGTECSSCPVGWAADFAEAPKCSPCVEGRYSPANGTSVCFRCPIGWASSIPRSSLCLLCEAGRSQGVLGGTSCGDCQPGFFAPTDASVACLACPVGFYQPLRVKDECLPCPVGKMSTTASRDCVDIPPSEDIESPRIITAEVVFSRKNAVDGLPLHKDSPAEVRQLNIVVEEPKHGVGSRGQYDGVTVAPISTVVWWAQREDFLDKEEVGRVYAAGWNSETGMVERVSTSVERYTQLTINLSSSLYTQGFILRLQAASQLNDTSWTHKSQLPTLPCPTLLGSGSTGLPCPPFDFSTGPPSEPKILLGEYLLPNEVDNEWKEFEDSLFNSSLPIVKRLSLAIELPTFREIDFGEQVLDDMVLGPSGEETLRQKTPTCLFTQIEWSPDSNFARLFVGGRPSCDASSNKIINAVVDNFDMFSEFRDGIFSYPQAEPLLYVRVRSFLSDTSTSGTVNQVFRFPKPTVREPQSDGDEDFAPQLVNDTILDKWTIRLKLRPPTLRPELLENDPNLRILFLEIQISNQLQFREVLDVMYNSNPQGRMCSHARNETYDVNATGGAAESESDSDDDDDYGDGFSDLVYGSNIYVPGCVRSKRVRILMKPHAHETYVYTNVTFPASIYEQSYYIRISAVLSDSSVILQDQTYDRWGASSRGCAYAGEYLQTHTNNDLDRPYLSVGSLRCRPCPIGASCSGKFVTFETVTARSGYRRLTWNHSVFGACPVAEACEGIPDVTDSSTGEVISTGDLAKTSRVRLEKCRHGHAENSELCSSCIQKYLVRLTANPAGTCSECPAEGTNFFMFASLIMIAMAYMAFLILDSLKGAQEIIEKDIPMPFHTIAIRIFSSYLQVAGMLMSFRITLPDAVASLVTVQRSASAVVEQTLSFDCTAGSRRGLELFFMKQTLAVTLPLLLPLVSCIWLIVNSCRRMLKREPIKYITDKIVASVVVLYYLVFPAVVSRIAITFACTEFGDDGFQPNRQFLMQNSLSTKCYSTSHKMHIASVTVPAIILYMLLIPVYLMHEIHRLRRKQVLYRHDKNYEPGWTYRFGFLFAGYEPKYAFWEIVVLVRKAAFVLVTVFTRPAGMAGQVTAAVLVLILSLSAHIHFSPYDHDSHDELESAALHASLITLPVALLSNEMSRVYGTGTIGEGGKLILGPVESLVFSMTAFLTFGLFVYLFFHGILMEKVDDPGLMGKISRTICKCWHSKDKNGEVIRIKPARSKSVRRKTIRRAASIHGSSDMTAQLMKMGIGVDEIASEIPTFSAQVSTTSEISKVHPVLPDEETKRAPKQNGERLINDTMGSAYLDLLPKGVGPVKQSEGSRDAKIATPPKPSEPTVRSSSTPRFAAQGTAAADNTRALDSHTTTVAMQKNSSNTIALGPDNDKSAMGDASGGYDARPPNINFNMEATKVAPVHTASPILNAVQPPKMPQLGEFFSLKELKKNYKSAKAAAKENPDDPEKLQAYRQWKARYVQAKDKAKNDE